MRLQDAVQMLTAALRPANGSVTSSCCGTLSSLKLMQAIVAAMLAEALADAHCMVRSCTA